MREMKDSGIKWIGTIPQQWNVVKFKALFTPKSIPNSGDRELLSVYLDRGVIRYSDSSNMQVHKPSESLDKYQNVDIGDFVLNNQQAWRGSVGVSKYKGIISPAYLIYEMSKECFPQYMNYALRDCYMVQQYEYCSRGVGTIQRNVSPQWLKQALVLLPPLDEQKRISEYLDEECSQIDGLIADIQAQIDVLEQYKRSQITEAVTRGLVSNEPLKESGLAWIGNIPERWRVMPNKYLMKKLKLIQPVYAGEDIISLTVNGVIKRDLDNPSGKMPASFDGYQFVYPGNLLMCLFDIDVTPRCIGLIKDFGLTSPAYSQFVLNSKADAGYYYYYYL
ncbi:MAG: restriction endonuclease subunit S, partial [Oscillospiraceae bacterium]|nr:restriction endonuclease subunit S [Oscillospiraceae bacterium]